MINRTATKIKSRTICETGSEPRHRADTAWSTGSRWLLVGTIVLVVAGVLAGLLMGRGGTDEPAGVAGGNVTSGVGAEGPLTGPPTLFGQVESVIDPATVVVRVDDRPVTVSVIGVDISQNPECARSDALDFARETLDGQQVTLVPDPTLPAPEPDAPTWPAYLVLPSQQSYTDAALVAGWASPGEGRYRAGFETGEELAQDADAGMWGPPCNRPVPG